MYDSVKKLAQEVRDYLFFILKNGKILPVLFIAKQE